MSHFHDRLLLAMKQCGVKAVELSAKSGISKSSLSQYTNGRYIPKRASLVRIARALNVREDWLSGEDAPMHGGCGYSEINAFRPTHIIPILGTVSAGQPLYAKQQIDGHMVVDLNGGAEYFGLRVSGDSMTAARIHENDIVVVRRQSVVENGEIAVVLVGSEDATIKRFYRQGDIVTLVPQSNNSKYKIQTYDIGETEIHVLGKVVRNEINFE